MKAIVVRDQAAGTAGMALVERSAPLAAINDVVVQVQASGFVPTELTWPSTWNIGNVSTLDDAVAAFNPTKRSKGKTIIRVRP